MKKLFQVIALIAGIWMVGAAPGFARHHSENSHGHGGGVPAPAIGAGVVGLLVAGGLASYIRRHRRG